MWALFREPCDENVIRSRAATAPCSKTSGRWVLAATILASSMAFIDGTVVNVALPALQSSLNATAVDLQWVIEAYSLLLSALLLVGGSLGDHYGRRRIFLIGVALFAAASAACGFAGDIRQLIAARALQGVGAALLVPGSLAIISSSFSENERGRAIGTWSGFSAITAGIGPVMGGWLIEHVSWRAVFFLPLNLIQVQHYSATAAGAALLPFILIISFLSRWSGGLIVSYGAKLPLIVGPLIAAIGFGLFMLPNVGGGYWTNFCPPILILGLGMAISVAPLTTTVMNSVASNRAGIASGVNNAVARTAGLLAIAVLGIVMLHVFSGSLDQRLAEYKLPSSASRSLQAQRTKLAAIAVPEDQDPATQQLIRRAIDESFVSGFRSIMAIGAVLAVASAVTALTLIGTIPPRQN